MDLVADLVLEGSVVVNFVNIDMALLLRAWSCGPGYAVAVLGSYQPIYSDLGVPGPGCIHGGSGGCRTHSSHVESVSWYRCCNLALERLGAPYGRDDKSRHGLARVCRDGKLPGGMTLFSKLGRFATTGVICMSYPVLGLHMAVELNLCL